MTDEAKALEGFFVRIMKKALQEIGAAQPPPVAAKLAAKEYLSPAEAEAEFCMSQASLRAHVRSGRLVRYGSPRNPLYRRVEMETLVAPQGTRASERAAIDLEGAELLRRGRK